MTAVVDPPSSPPSSAERARERLTDVPVGTTNLPVRDPEQPPARPLPRLGGMNPDERFVRLGAWFAALGLAWLITQRFLPLAGIPWFVVVLFLAGVFMTALLTTMTGTWVEVKDRVAGAVVAAGAVLVGFGLVTAIVFVCLRGWRPLLHTNFFTSDMSGIEPKADFEVGGVLHAMTGSMIQLGIALLVTLPLGIGTAIFMTEVGGRFAKIVRTVVEAMTALPSIVAGLFIYTTLILALGLDRSGFCAGMAIAVMMLPIIARASDVVLRVVPGTLREASLALGASQWRTVWHVVLPTARPGLATAVILGVARGVGETSPVLLTSGAAPFVTTNPFEGEMNSLPLFVYVNARSPEPNAITRAFAGALVLIVLVLVLFVIARLLARPRGNKPSLLRRLGAVPRAATRLSASVRRSRQPSVPPAPPSPPSVQPPGSPS